MKPNTPLSSGIIPPKFTPGGITWVYEQSKSADPPEQMTIDASETITAEVRTLEDFFNPQQNFKKEL